MIPLLIGILCAAVLAMFFSTITFALRDFSRTILEEYLVSYRKSEWLESTVKHRDELTFITAVGRLFANICILLGALRLFHHDERQLWIQYAAAGLLAIVLSSIFSVAIPMTLAESVGEPAIALFVRFLHAMRVVLYPLTWVMHLSRTLVHRATGKPRDPEPEQIEKEILSVVEEGEKEGIVDRQERQMIESVIEFRDTTVDQTMTARPEIVAIEIASTLDQVKRTLEESGHSRLPVYDGTLDHIIGVLYARDLLKHLGMPPEQFNIRAAMRPPVFVPETKPLRDLLREFRQQKVHIAIVLDEYGGTAGLVTIEDILEELVGDISDEHEPQEPAMFKRLNDTSYEADARIYVNDINRQCGMRLPEDAGYDTLGGFVTTVLGRIPARGTSFEQHGARFTVLDAEPQRVKRLKIELLPSTAEAI